VKIFTKRNALIGWIALRVALRRIRARLERPQKKNRRPGLLVAAGFAAGATVAGVAAGAAHVVKSRGSREPTHAMQ
jgi:uncharacterized oligopeptide transporter (OPT) family protein